MTTTPRLLAPFFALAFCVACAGSKEPAPEPTAGQASQPKPELGTFGVDLSTRKISVNPGDDFFSHANGAWLDTYQLKPDEKRYGAFIELSYRSEDQVKAIINELAAANPQPGTIEQKIGDFYASYMDTDTRNQLGIEPLKPGFARIDAIASKADLIAAFGKAGVEGTNSPIGMGIGIDDKNPSRYVLTLRQAGLGLPDRDYYLQDDEQLQKVRAAYQEHIAKMLKLSGVEEGAATESAAAILALETELAKHHWPRTELRDRNKTYNLFTLNQLTQDFPGFDWQSFLAAGDVTEPGEMIVATPSAFTPIVKVVNETPLDTWKMYLRYHYLAHNASYLSQELDDAHFAFVGPVLSGQQEQRALWKRAVNQVSSRWGGLGDAIGQVYVKRHFPPESKAMMVELVENLRAAFRERIQTLDWMGEATKVEALRKLEAFRPKIGYPDKWWDFSSLRIEKDDLFGNMERVRAFFHADEIARLTRPTDKDEWFMNPQTVNAYYNPPFNEIVFPAAILQPPFFDPHADPAVNYGAIGAVIGHEMGHGFDDQGSKYNADGVLQNWWTEEDRARFEERTKALVAQYNDYEALPNQRVNGELTQGENIGDLGGLSVAYHAYKLSLGGKEAPVVDGLTGDQRFFLSWAQVWRTKNREAFLLQRLKADPHSPEMFRVNGVVRNIDAWYRAFGVEPQHQLFLPPESRVAIW